MVEIAQHTIDVIPKNQEDRLNAPDTVPMIRQTNLKQSILRQNLYWGPQNNDKR